MNLKGNRLKSIQNVFQDFPDIQYVNIGQNVMLTHLSDETFTGRLPWLKILFMDDCRLRKLPPKLLKPLTQLQWINLSFNRLLYIPEAFFHNLKHLKSVNLRGNQLVSVSNMFKGNTFLKNLYLSNNAIRNLDNIFISKFALKTVDLSSNHLWKLNEFDFKSCALVENLLLNNNKIHSIDTDTFINMKNLKWLQIYNNRLHSLNGSFRALHSLEYLDLRSNSLKAINEHDMLSLKNLKTLILKRNQLWNINGAFKNLVRLTSLQLERNILNFLPRNAFPPNMTVQDLHLSGNKWVCDCRLSWLRDLFIAKNITDSKRPLVCHKPHRFVGQKLVDLSADDLIDWPDNCPLPCKCSCVSENETFYVGVDCSRRDLMQVPSMFPPEIGSLDLQGNYLTNPLTLQMDDMTGLRFLNLENNTLKKMDFVAKLPNNLTTLRLAGNNFTRFLKPALLGVKLWTLSNNPWKCDCDTKDFLKWMLQNKDKIIDVNSTKCGPGNSIKSLDDKVIVRLEELDLCPHFISLYIVVAVCALVVLLVGTSSLLTYSRYHYHIKVWLYSRGITWLKRREDQDNGKKYDAFISAADIDLPLVKNLLIPELEEKEPYYMLFEPRRDMNAGEMFEFEKEMKEVTNSKRVIILLSKDYIENNFLMEIFKVAFAQSLEDKLYRLILIAVGELPSLSSMDQSLKAAIESTRCLRFDQKLFWEMIRFAMPKKEEDWTDELRINEDVPMLEY